MLWTYIHSYALGCELSLFEWESMLGCPPPITPPGCSTASCAQPTFTQLCAVRGIKGRPAAAAICSTCAVVSPAHLSSLPPLQETDESKRTELAAGLGISPEEQAKIAAGGSMGTMSSQEEEDSSIF